MFFELQFVCLTNMSRGTVSFALSFYMLIIKNKANCNSRLEEIHDGGNQLRWIVDDKQLFKTGRNCEKWKMIRTKWDRDV